VSKRKVEVFFGYLCGPRSSAVEVNQLVIGTSGARSSSLSRKLVEIEERYQ
jgi:hypothetical protein